MNQGVLVAMLVNRRKKHVCLRKASFFALVGAGRSCRLIVAVPVVGRVRKLTLAVRTETGSLKKALSSVLGDAGRSCGLIVDVHGVGSVLSNLQRLSSQSPAAPLSEVGCGLGSTASDSQALTVDVQCNEILGAGSFGKVFKGIMFPKQTFCAVKTAKIDDVYVCGSGSEWSDADMLKAESALLQQLNHDNILSCFGVFEDNGTQCAVLEYCDGGDLKHYLSSLRSRGSCLCAAEIRCYMQQLLSAVARIHECSLAHQDIKPDNVLKVPHGCCPWTKAC